MRTGPGAGGLSYAGAAVAHPRLRVAVLCCERGRILLVEHRRLAEPAWLLPGGGVEPGEPLAAAAAREVREEVGLTVEVGPPVVLAESIEPGGGRHVIHLILRGRVRPGPASTPTDPAVRAARWVALSALGTLRLHPPIPDLLRAGCAQAWNVPVPLRMSGPVWDPEGP